MTRLYGRAPVGERLVAKVPHGHWKTLTLVGALRVDGVTAPYVIDGAMDGAAFLAYVEQVLAPTLKQRDIVFMDNVRTTRWPASPRRSRPRERNCAIPSDIALDLWQKFVIIVMLSSITSAMRSTIGPIRANPHARSFALDLMREVVAVGRARGIALEADFADKRVAVIDGLSPDMRASMSLDLELGRPLELPWLAGAVIDLGSKKGIPTPCCRAVRDILAIYVDGKPA
jgi:2-dehydropantoate 2-reductase